MILSASWNYVGLVFLPIHIPKWNQGRPIRPFIFKRTIHQVNEGISTVTLILTYEGQLAILQGIVVFPVEKNSMYTRYFYN